MALHAHLIIILLSTIVIISYLFNLVSRKTNIPSVILLIATGIGIQYMSAYMGYAQQDVGKLVKILGAIGLIMIVLEASLDLKINREKVPLIRNSFLSALFIFLVSAAGISFIIMQLLDVPFQNAFIYAVPLSIISSAIVIPSTEHLPSEKKEFIIYESSFSDIIGIMVFNYMLMQNVMSIRSAAIFTGNIFLAVAISAIATFLLIYLLTKIQINIKFFLAFAILALVYTLGEQIHLPSLLIVMVFGLVLNNINFFIKGPVSKWIDTRNIDEVMTLMTSITAETSFLIRTFFFILFGYSIDVTMLMQEDVWQTGSVIVLALLCVRFLYLRLILKANLFPEMFLMPRGLVTILLFYSIPEEKSLGNFNEGILFFVVFVTSLLMMIGLLFFRKDKSILANKGMEAI